MKSRDERHRNAWNDLGRTDPLWAVLSDPAKRGGHWDVGEFLATGEADIASLMTIANRLGHPQGRSTALDFGAGVGRLSIALGTRFEKVTGLDVSTSMIELARSNARHLANVTFEVADRDSLAKLPAGSFDLVVSMWVLQHLAAKEDIRGALQDLARLVGVAGLLAVQLPGEIPLRHRLQPRRRAYSALRWLRIRPSTLLNQLGLSPIRMTGLRQVEVRRILEKAGLTILEVHATVIPRSSIDSYVYYAIMTDRPIPTR